MKFWDSSAVVPLLAQERKSEMLHELRLEDPALLVWWATSVECVSALARMEREGLDAAAVGRALQRLADLEIGWSEVQPSERLRAQANRLLRVHPLRGADALQLAAAVVGAELDARSLTFVTLDERLALAAQREGFTLVPRLGEIS
jgi:uncharacterized protein